MPINMYLVKPNATYEYKEKDDVHMGGNTPIADADEFCGLPHVPGVIPKTFDWGEYFGD